MWEMDPPITACKGRGLGIPPYVPPKPEKGKKKKGKKKGKKGKKGAPEPPAKPVDDGDGFRWVWPSQRRCDGHTQVSAGYCV